MAVASTMTLTQSCSIIWWIFSILSVVVAVFDHSEHSSSAILVGPRENELPFFSRWQMIRQSSRKTAFNSVLNCADLLPSECKNLITAWYLFFFSSCTKTLASPGTNDCEQQWASEMAEIFTGTFQSAYRSSTRIVYRSNVILMFRLKTFQTTVVLITYRQIYKFMESVEKGDRDLFIIWIMCWTTTAIAWWQRKVVPYIVSTRAISEFTPGHNTQSRTNLEINISQIGPTGNPTWDLPNQARNSANHCASKGVKVKSC